MGKFKSFAQKASTQDSSPPKTPSRKMRTPVASVHSEIDLDATAELMRDYAGVSDPVDIDEVTHLGVAIENSSKDVNDSLCMLLKSLKALEEWRDMVAAQHVLPNNVLAQITVIASQLLRGKTQLTHHVNALHAACSAAAPKKLIRDTAILQQDMKLAKRDAHVCEQKARVAEAKANALDNRIPLVWFKLAHALTMKAMRLQNAENQKKYKRKVAEAQKQLSDSIKSREYAAAKNKAQMATRTFQPRTLQDWYEVKFEGRATETILHPSREGQRKTRAPTAKELAIPQDGVLDVWTPSHPWPASIPGLDPVGGGPEDDSSAHWLRGDAANAGLPLSLSGPSPSSRGHSAAGPGSGGGGGGGGHPAGVPVVPRLRLNTLQAVPHSSGALSSRSANAEQRLTTHSQGSMATSLSGPLTHRRTPPHPHHPQPPRSPRRRPSQTGAPSDTSDAVLFPDEYEQQPQQPQQQQGRQDLSTHSDFNTRRDSLTESDGYGRSRESTARGSTAGERGGGVEDERGGEDGGGVGSRRESVDLGPSVSEHMHPLHDHNTGALDPNSPTKTNDSASGAGTWRVTSGPIEQRAQEHTAGGGRGRGQREQSIHQPGAAGLGAGGSWDLRGYQAVQAALAQEPPPVAMKENYTRAELMDCRLAHSRQLHRVQLAYEHRLQILADFWKSQAAQSQGGPRGHTSPEVRPGQLMAGPHNIARGPQVRIVEHSFTYPVIPGQGYSSGDDEGNFIFRPQPPLAFRTSAQAHDCRASKVKYRYGGAADKFVQEHWIPKRPDMPHLQVDPWQEPNNTA